MALAVELLGPGQLDQRSLKRIAADRRDLPIPSFSTVNRHLRKHHPKESWEQWRREAEARARAPRIVVVSRKRTVLMASAVPSASSGTLQLCSAMTPSTRLHRSPA